MDEDLVLEEPLLAVVGALLREDHLDDLAVVRP